MDGETIGGCFIQINPHTIESLSYLASLAHEAIARLGECTSPTERRELFEAAEQMLLGISDTATELP